MDQNKKLVDFSPAPGMVNTIIGNLMRTADTASTQEMASFVASNVAALAFVMCDSNPPERIKELFGALIDDAHKQYQTRKEIMERENSNVLRMRPNDGK